MYPPAISANRYDFIGQERQNISSSLDPYIDFGARFYDPLTARWLSPDPLADKYTSLMQYNYCGGDPVNYIDFHGDTLMVVDQYEINAINNGLLNEHRGLLRFNNGILDPTSIPNSDDFFINEEEY